jgi:hypothetical protein
MIEPRRLLDRSIDENAASELGTALREARSATGSAEQIERLRQRLDAGGDAAGGAGGEAAAAELSTLAAAKGWTVLGALVLSALGVAAYLTAGAREAAPMQRARPAVASAEETRTVASAAHVRGGVGAAANEEVQPMIADRPTPPAAQPEVAAAPKPRVRRERVASRSERNDADSAPAAPARATIDPDAELALLTRAEQALQLKPALTLAILHEHAQRFPDGVLAQERDILSIDAELALGRKDAAATRARAFLIRFPSSPHRHRFESMLGVQPQVERDHKIDAPSIPTDATPARR